LSKELDTEKRRRFDFEEDNDAAEEDFIGETEKKHDL